MTELREPGALRPDAAARWLGLSRDSIERLIRAGRLRSFKVGSARLISLSELRRFVRDEGENQ